MANNLLEAYKPQLKIAEAYVAKNFGGKEVSASAKLATAVLLDNTERFMTESVDSGITSHGDLGAWKKFCLNLTNISVPSLIANDLVIVHPMTSISGSVAYLEYQALSDKNDMQGKTLNGVFGLGEMTDGRVAYTTSIVVEAVGTEPTADDIVKGGIVHDENGAVVGNTFKFTGAGKDTIYVDDFSKGAGYDKVAYVAKAWQMDTTPQTNIPTIGPKLNRIALVAEPRRIAVRYDQITAFQAKTDYGFSLDKQIAEQAVGELAYEIDTEIVDMLREGAGDALTELTWNKRLPVGVSKFEHYNGFLEIVEIARSIVYKRTGKFHPNYMVIGASVLPILKFINGFTAVRNAKMNGPYKVGSLDSLDVYVSPRLGDNEFFFGLNGSDMMSSAGVYAPYMAIVPTQLLGTPDGGLAQGFSTYYAKALLNKSLLVAGKIVDEAY